MTSWNTFEDFCSALHMLLVQCRYTHEVYTVYLAFWMANSEPWTLDALRPKTISLIAYIRAGIANGSKIRRFGLSLCLELFVRSMPMRLKMRWIRLPSSSPTHCYWNAVATTLPTRSWKASCSRSRWRGYQLKYGRLTHFESYCIIRI